jgi:hypothetical protein
MRAHRWYLLSTAVAVLVTGTAWALPAADSPAAGTTRDPAAGHLGIPEGHNATILDVARLVAPQPVAAPENIDSGPPPGAKVYIWVTHGRGQNTSKETGRTQFETPLYDAVSGDEVGMSKHNFVCDGFLSCEDIDTYILPEGTLTKKARVSFNQDGERPGWVLVGAAPDVGPLEGTGAFEGKTGSVRVGGWANTSELPDAMTLNEFYIVTIHP